MDKHPSVLSDLFGAVNACAETCGEKHLFENRVIYISEKAHGICVIDIVLILDGFFHRLKVFLRENTTQQLLSVFDKFDKIIFGILVYIFQYCVNRCADCGSFCFFSEGCLIIIFSGLKRISSFSNSSILSPVRYPI